MYYASVNDLYKHIIGTYIVHWQLGHILTGIKSYSSLAYAHIAKPIGLENLEELLYRMYFIYCYHLLTICAIKAFINTWIDSHVKQNSQHSKGGQAKAKGG